MPEIRVKNGPAKGRIVSIIPGKIITLGRDPQCVIQILDKGVSRNHAEIFRIGDMCFIRDLKSRNGTFVNDQHTSEEMLREGDQIQIGATVLEYETGDSFSNSNFEFLEEYESATSLELKLEDLTSLNVSCDNTVDAMHLRALYSLGRIICEEFDEKSLIAKTLPFVSEQLRSDSAYLFMRNPENGVITNIGSYVRPGSDRDKISQTIIKRAIVEKRGIITADAAKDNRFSERDSIVIKEIRSAICVPLSVSGNLSGVLYLTADPICQVFHKQDLELAAAMADQIGLAISHLRVMIYERKNLLSTICAIIRVAELNEMDKVRRGHAERTARYAAAIANEFKLSPNEIDAIELAGLLHDLAFFRGNPESDTPQQRLKYTLEIVKNMMCYPQVKEALEYQLERNDGSGPHGLRGYAIPTTARILAVACELDLLSGGNLEAFNNAVNALLNQSGSRLDLNVIKAVQACHGRNELFPREDGVMNNDTGKV